MVRHHGVHVPRHLLPLQTPCLLEHVRHHVGVQLVRRDRRICIGLLRLVVLVAEVAERMSTVRRLLVGGRLTLWSLLCQRLLGV